MLAPQSTSALESAMPSIANHISEKSVKMLLLGESGSGKTGLLGTLPPAGYRLFIADFDSGLDILRDPKVLDPKYHEQVFFKTFYDKMNIAGGSLSPQATGYSDFTKAMGNWMEDGKSMGGIYSWTENDVFVIDSLTFLGNMIMNYVLQLAGRVGQKPQLQDFGAAVDSQEAIIETLYNPAVKCNVIVTAHIQRQEDGAAGNVMKGFPSAIGKKLPPKIGRYFNSMVQIKKTGFGANVKREIYTTATTDIDLKVAKPSLIPPVLPPDLGDLFKRLKA